VAGRGPQKTALPLESLTKKSMENEKSHRARLTVCNYSSGNGSDITVSVPRGQKEKGKKSHKGKEGGGGLREKRGKKGPWGLHLLRSSRRKHNGDKRDVKDDFRPAVTLRLLTSKKKVRRRGKGVDAAQGRGGGGVQ